MLVAIWSNVHGQTGTTAATTAIGCCIGSNYKFETLLMHSQYRMSNLEGAFPIDENKSAFNFDDTGIDSIERLAKSNNLSPSNFGDHTNTIIPERLFLLPGSMKTREENFDSLMDTILYILYCAKEYYKLTFIDVNSGTRNGITNKVLKEVDLIVVVLNQNLSVLKSFFNKEEWHEELDNKPYIIALGNYDPNSKYTASYIKRLFKYDGEIYTIPNNTDYKDSLNDRRVKEFFYCNNEVDKKDKNYYFMNEVGKVSKKIVEASELAAFEQNPIKNRSLKANFRKLFVRKGAV